MKNDDYDVISIIYIQKLNLMILSDVRCIQKSHLL